MITYSARLINFVQAKYNQPIERQRCRFPVLNWLLHSLYQTPLIYIETRWQVCESARLKADGTDDQKRTRKIRLLSLLPNLHRQKLVKIRYERRRALGFLFHSHRLLESEVCCIQLYCVENVYINIS